MRKPCEGAEPIDGVISLGRLNATKAALSGAITFDGSTRAALTLQRVQRDLTRLSTQARTRVLV